jgi:hypothetical protein
MIDHERPETKEGLGEAPGERDETPGERGEAPGERGEAPGERGEAPGERGEAPRERGTERVDQEEPDPDAGLTAAPDLIEADERRDQAEG